MNMSMEVLPDDRLVQPLFQPSPFYGMDQPEQLVALSDLYLEMEVATQSYRRLEARLSSKHLDKAAIKRMTYQRTQLDEWIISTTNKIYYAIRRLSTPQAIPEVSLAYLPLRFLFTAHRAAYTLQMDTWRRGGMLDEDIRKQPAEIGSPKMLRDVRLIENAFQMIETEAETLNGIRVWYENQIERALKGL